MHEVTLTEELIPFRDLKIKRGNQVDKNLNPDATITYGVLKIHCEMDMDTEGYEQVKTQMKRYERRGEYVVWFAPTMTRLKGIMKFASKNSLFSVCGSKVWIDAEKNKLSVDQARELFGIRGA